MSSPFFGSLFPVSIHNSGASHPPSQTVAMNRSPCGVYRSTLLRLVSKSGRKIDHVSWPSGFYVGALCSEHVMAGTNTKLS